MSDLDAGQFKLLLIQSDLQEQYAGWEGFSKLISGAVQMDKNEGFSGDFQRDYAELLNAGDMQGLMQRLIFDQMDNYILGSMAAFQLDLPKVLPLVPFAAENKMLYEGLRGEISNLRMLLLMGFDANAANPGTGNTALHSMCNLKWGKGIHNRAIECLLQSGASPNSQNNSGDTPFVYLCGSYPWTPECHKAAAAMLEFGADPYISSKDGSTGLSLLQANQTNQDESPARQALIDVIELQGTIKTPPKQRSAPTL